MKIEMVVPWSRDSDPLSDTACHLVHIFAKSSLRTRPGFVS